MAVAHELQWRPISPEISRDASGVLAFSSQYIPRSRQLSLMVPMPNLRVLHAVRPLASVCLLLLLCAGGRAAAAQALAPPGRLCDPAFQDCRADVLNYTQQESVGIDMGFWFMFDARYSNALVAAWQRAEGLVWNFPAAGVPPPPPTVTLVRGPYLQQPSERSMVVVWATREAGAAEVRYSTSGAWFTAPATSRLVANADTAIGYDYFQHEAHVAGLTPATSYSYQPFVDGVAAAPPASFRTAPLTGAGAVSFIAFGDSGTGSAEQRQLAGIMARDRFDLALHVGDIAYGNSSGTGDATYSTYQSLLFDIYNWFPAVPFVPVEGNHDSRPSNGDGRAYLDLFSLPTNGASVARPDHAERYYSFDYGPVHFVALDTEFAFQDAARRPEQLAWLEADLAATRQPWTVALYHRSPYSSGGEHGSDQVVRATFGPLFERYGVDLVLTGHEHAYERTVPIRESTVAADQAVPYVVTGGGGAPLYPAATSSWTAHSASRHQYVKVVADGCTLTLDAVGLDGVVFDRSSVSRCASPPPSSGLPAGWSNADVGTTGAAGTSTFAGGTYTVTGAGADVWGTADAFQYVYRTLEGDGSIAARVASIQGGIANWVKAGVMMRGSLSPASAQGFMLVSWAKGIAFQRRLTDGSSSVSTAGVRSTAPRWVKLTRTGNTITAFESADGSAWTLVASDTFVMGASIDVGLAVSSHVTGVNATATFDTVTVTTVANVPPPPPPPPPPVNAAPSVELTAPAGGATALAPATVSLAATAADPDGTIARVEFYAGGTSVGVATAAPYRVGVATAAPYTVTWSGVAAGTYSLTAVAIDNLGLATVSGAVLFAVTAPPPPMGLPAEWSNADVGPVPFPGNTAFTSGTYTVTGAGADVWGTADQFHYAYRAWTGDGTIVARVASEQNVSSWVKAGVMIRQTLAPDAPHAFMLVSPAKGTAFQRRTVAGGATTSTPGPLAAAPRWVKLTRGGDLFTAYDSADGVAWTLVGTETIPMGATVFAGIAVTSHNPGATATATFDGVTIR